MGSNTISTRQLCFILAFFFPVNKLVILPSVLAGTAGNDLLLAALLPLIFEGGAIFALLWLMQKTDKTLFELIEQKFGGTTARVCYFILALYFLFSVLLPLLEHRVYVQNTMYDTRPSFWVFLPFFFFSCFAAAKGLQCIGRAADVGMPVFSVAFTLLLLMAVASADFTSLLPVGHAPFPDVLKGATSSLNWFSESAWLLLFLGRVKTEKRFLLKTSLSFLGGGLIVLLFLAIFYGIFSTVSVREVYAIAKIARYYNALKTIGRVDYIFIYALMLVQLFALVVPLQLCVHALAESFHSEKYPLFSLIVNGALLLFALFFSDRFLSIEKVVNGYLFPVFLLFAYLIPALCPLFLLSKRKKGGNLNEK